MRDPQFDGPVGKLRLGYKVVETLGWRWVLTRLYLEAEHRSGVLKRRTPPTSWAAHQLAGQPTYRQGGLHPQAAGECIRVQPVEVADELREHLELLKERRFDVFGTRVLIDDWHHDPIDDAAYPREQHWSEVKELPDADLKLIWEPSRFGWAFDLARLHALDPASAAPDVFWLLFEDWCEANQPYCGVNWKCGQEAAVRFMAITFATLAFEGAGLNPERQLLLAKFADVTARRIKAHWRYAKSQDNNHIVSEAVGLIGVALRFPDLEIADEALELGQRLLIEACERLVFEDGGTSQYSSNYHRVFVDNFIWAVWLYRTAGLEPPIELTSALKRAGDFMCAITNPVHGDMASYGNNDGAHLLPLATNAFADVRSTILAASLTSSCSRTKAIPASSQELSAWLFGALHHSSARRADSSCPPPARVYEEAGLAILANGQHRAVIRGTCTTFRSQQADFGHIELWIDGLKVLSDLGTFSYKPHKQDPDLSTDIYHNSPRAPQAPVTGKLTRFLWERAPTLNYRVRLSDQPSLTLQFTTPTVQFKRELRSLHDGWLVIDSRSDASRGLWATAILSNCIRILPTIRSYNRVPLVTYDCDSIHISEVWLTTSRSRSCTTTITKSTTQ